MGCYGAKEIARSFRTVRRNTTLIAEDIPEEQYGFRASEDTRTVAQTLVHIAVMTRVPLQIHAVERRSTLAGFDFFTTIGKLMGEEQTPRSKADILALLREEGDKFAGWVETLSDDFLSESVAYPPGMVPASKSRFEMLLSAKEHEMHHRGQLMLMERMIGVVPHLTRQLLARMAAMAETSRGAAS
jgi:uncharacterized damage-inducible protein DinB